MKERSCISIRYRHLRVPTKYFYSPLTFPKSVTSCLSAALVLWYIFHISTIKIFGTNSLVSFQLSALILFQTEFSIGFSSLQKLFLRQLQLI